MAWEPSGSGLIWISSSSFLFFFGTENELALKKNSNKDEIENRLLIWTCFVKVAPKFLILYCTFRGGIVAFKLRMGLFCMVPWRVTTMVLSKWGQSGQSSQWTRLTGEDSGGLLEEFASYLNNGVDAAFLRLGPLFPNNACERLQKFWGAFKKEICILLRSLLFLGK